MVDWKGADGFGILEIESMELTDNLGKKMVSRLTSVSALSNLGFAGPFIETGRVVLKRGWVMGRFKSSGLVF